MIFTGKFIINESEIKYIGIEKCVSDIGTKYTTIIKLKDNEVLRSTEYDNEEDAAQGVKNIYTTMI